jgi:hypothetical protein
MSDLQRRTLLGRLALAPVAIVAGIPCSANATHLDAELLNLVAEWQKLSALCDAATKIESDAEARCVWPDEPEAIFAREGDSRLFWSRTPSRRYDNREWWLPQIDFFRNHKLIHEGWSHPDARNPEFEARKRRADEIVAAYDERKAERRRIGKESGFTDAAANARELHKVNCELQACILEARATTMDGLLAKATVVRWCYAGTHEHFLEEIGDDIGEHGVSDHGTSLSIIRDLICMNPAVDHA